jgi:hypothetical protein
VRVHLDIKREFGNIVDFGREESEKEGGKYT